MPSCVSVIVSKSSSSVPRVLLPPYAVLRISTQWPSAPYLDAVALCSVLGCSGPLLRILRQWRSAPDWGAAATATAREGSPASLCRAPHLDAVALCSVLGCSGALLRILGQRRFAPDSEAVALCTGSRRMSRLRRDVEHGIGARQHSRTGAGGARPGVQSKHAQSAKLPNEQLCSTVVTPYLGSSLWSVAMSLALH